jgi:hypothetical protein
VGDREEGEGGRKPGREARFAEKQEGEGGRQGRGGGWETIFVEKQRQKRSNLESEENLIKTTGAVALGQSRSEKRRTFWFFRE